MMVNKLSDREASEKVLFSKNQSCNNAGLRASKFKNHEFFGALQALESNSSFYGLTIIISLADEPSLT